MARRDVFHEAVKQALQKENWIITDDPLDLSVGEVELLADLGAEKVIGAEKDNEKIAVEIKSFLSQSPVSEFHKALGQYENYRISLEEIEPNRQIWLAISLKAWQDFFQRPFIQKVLKKQQIKCIVFDPKIEEIVGWIN